VNENGLMGYISNTFDKTSAGNVLREYLQDKTRLIEYIDFTEVQIFEGATTYPVIIIVDKIQNDKNVFKYIKIPKESQSKVIEIDNHFIIDVLQNSLVSKSWSFSSIEKTKIYNKLNKLPNVREVYGKCYYGVKTALNEAFIVEKDWKNSKHVKPILEGKEIKKWNVQEAKQKLILFESKWTNKTYDEGNTAEYKFNFLKKDFPKITSHLEQFKERAIKRYDQGDYWWELRNCAYYDLFEKPKIIFPNLQNSNKFCLDEDGFFVCAPAVFLPIKSKTLLCILNSKIVWEFLKSICVVRSGGYIEVKPQYFEQIPIPEFKNEEAFEIKAINIISYVDESQRLDNKFQTYLKQKFQLEKLIKKLQNWHELAFGDFIKELNKAVKTSNKQRLKDSLQEVPTLTNKDEFEWLDLFEENKQKAQALQTQINQTDKEIDAMVYELYGLTEDEIKIVESS
jgi:hypothetical protein